MRFLIIDDNPADRELIVHQLRKVYPDVEFVQVGRPDELEPALAEENYDIVLTDYQLNWTTGLRILHTIKEIDSDLPVIMFTGTGSEEIAVAGLHAGLSNYVLKKHLDRLPFAVQESLERLKLQKQLRLSEERYREIFEQGLTGVFAISPEGKLLTCNPAFARIFGFESVSDTLKGNMQELYSDPLQYRIFVERVRSERRLEYYETTMSRRDGSPVYVVETVVGSFDEAGKLQEIKGYLFDNTEQKRLAGQLQQAQKLESVGLLVSGIAHDFNNMLGGILGYANRGLARVTASHPLYDNLQHIQEISLRAAKMTQQLLAFSRRQVLEPREIDLNDIISNLLDFIGKVLADHITIEFEQEPTLQLVHADYGQIEQVLMNLCINARDAMPEGGTVRIMTRNIGRAEASKVSNGELRADAYVALIVQDTGVGMSEQVQAQIFEPFFTTKEVGKGTGLGLSMIHGIVGQHNGFIRVQSALGKGTTFTIYLPAAASQKQVEPALAVSPLQQKNVSPIEGGGETVLVVEDDPDLRFLMEEALSEYGYTVMSACDGSEGLKLFEEHGESIALVVSDLMTPRLKGKDLYDRIHALDEQVKFLFVSGYQANQISQNFVLDKGFVFLQKPFDLDELAAKVREVLAGDGKAEGANQANSSR